MQNSKRGKWPHSEGVPVITQSMVSSFASCPREVYYSSVLGLRPRLESMPLRRGTWVHELLEYHFRGLDWEEQHRKLVKKSQEDLFEEESGDMAKECYNIVSSYVDYYQNDPLKTVAVELTVERPLFNGNALYRGRIDLVVEDKEGNIWLMDHKTHRVIPDWQYRELNFQNYSYLWACRKAPQYKALGIPQPKGFIYDYCRTSAIKEPTLTTKGVLSRAFKAKQTTPVVLRNWLKSSGLLRTIEGVDMLAIKDPVEYDHVASLIDEVSRQPLDSFFRRDRMEFTKEQQVRQMKSFLCTAKRMLEYEWSDPDLIERNVSQCCSFMCRYKDLTNADLIHGSSELEQRTRYVTTDNPLDYYPNQDSEDKFSK